MGSSLNNPNASSVTTLTSVTGSTAGTGSNAEIGTMVIPSLTGSQILSLSFSGGPTAGGGTRVMQLTDGTNNIVQLSSVATYSAFGFITKTYKFDTGSDSCAYYGLADGGTPAIKTTGTLVNFYGTSQTIHIFGNIQVGTTMAWRLDAKIIG